MFRCLSGEDDQFERRTFLSNLLRPMFSLFRVALRSPSAQGACPPSRPLIGYGHAGFYLPVFRLNTPPRVAFASLTLAIRQLSCATWRPSTRLRILLRVCSVPIDVSSAASAPHCTRSSSDITTSTTPALVGCYVPSAFASSATEFTFIL